VLGLNVPNVLEWIGLETAGRLVWSSLLLTGGCVIAFRLSGRPRPVEPTTWAQAVLGAVLIFALMTLAYGIVPHEWLSYAGARLHWGEDTFFLRANRVIPFDVDRRAGADAVAALIYVVSLAAQVSLGIRWQTRPVAGGATGEASVDPPADEQGDTDDSEYAATTAPARSPRRLSAFGRPLTTRS